MITGSLKLDKTGKSPGDGLNFNCPVFKPLPSVYFPLCNHMTCLDGPVTIGGAGSTKVKIKPTLRHLLSANSRWLIPIMKLIILIFEKQGGITLLVDLFQPVLCLRFYVLLFLVF